LTYEISSDAKVTIGARVLEEYEGRIRVMAIMTGVQQKAGSFTGNVDYNRSRSKDMDMSRSKDNIIDFI